MPRGEPEHHENLPCRCGVAPCRCGVAARRALLAGLLMLAAGCTTDREIQRHAMMAHGSVLAHERELVHDARVDAFLDEMTDAIVAAARMRREERGGIPKGDAWIYDRFDAMVVLDRDANAYVAGDDVAVVNSGLIAQCHYPEQVVGVLCHEFAHIEERHIKERLNHAEHQSVIAGVAAVVRLVPGSIGGLARAAILGTDGISDGMFLEFSRQDEHDADSTGFDLYLRMGYDPEHVRTYFEKMRAVYGDGGSRTHPRTSERIARLDRQTADSAGPYLKLDYVEYREVRRRVTRAQSGEDDRSVMDENGARWIGCFGPAR